MQHSPSLVTGGLAPLVVVDRVLLQGAFARVIEDHSPSELPTAYLSVRAPPMSLLFEQHRRSVGDPDYVELAISHVDVAAAGSLPVAQTPILHRGTYSDPISVSTGSSMGSTATLMSSLFGACSDDR